MPPEGCGYWHTINKAAVDRKLDLGQERSIAEKQAKKVADGMLQIAASIQPIQEEEVDSDFDDEDEESDELSSLFDLYGYENDEDNEEAALDDVLKVQE